jgi:hypothetical protein
MDSVASNAQLDANAKEDRTGNHVFLGARQGAVDQPQCDNDPGSQASDNNSTDVMCGHDYGLFLRVLVL